MKSRLWLVYAVVTTVFWGIWGALIELPEKAGFPATLGYSVWALTMIPPALVALRIISWKLEHDLRSVFLGSAVGFLGAGGQLILFQALRMGPAYLVFPFISLSPVITILLSYLVLKEHASRRCWTGIALAMVAIPLLSFQPPRQGAGSGILWIALSFLVFLAWGIQAYVIKFANRTMKAESIFFYMAATGILLIPVAVWMTDFSHTIHWGLRGPWLAAGIQILNAVGALFLVYAFRHGKAIIVSPLTNAGAPVITIILSLALYRVVPHPVVAAGMALAVLAALLISIEPEGEPK
jgi:drug/metabolite transporter (DMT)-like permease